MLGAGAASALGRTPTSGRVALKVPWPVSTLDPHRLDDPTAALFGEAIADPLFALDAQGNPYPALAAALPTATRRAARVTLRPGLRTARGRALDSRDVVFSIERARRLGALGILSGLPKPTRDPADPLAVLFRGADPAEVARVLTSPITALLPRAFNPRAPDGTGAFVARPGRRRLVLARNGSAARGASFLASISVEAAKDLADALRAFEVGDVDVGWLGRGLHRPRPGSVRFDAGSAGWIVLRTGRDAGGWGAPGVAQRLLDAVAPSRLGHLGLGRLPSPRGSPAWNGPPSDLLAADDSPHLVEIARVLAAELSRPGHEVTLARRPPGRAGAPGRKRALLVDGRRRAQDRTAGPRHAAGASDRRGPKRRARRPPRLASYQPRQVTRTLPLGVVGELKIAGAHVPGLHLRGWDLGASWR